MTNELEEWRPVPGYEGGYAVSDHGRLWSLAKSIYVSPQFHRNKGKTNGYWRVALWDGAGAKKQVGVHVLVLLTFVGPRPSDHHETAHNNGNSTDNRLVNLRWATPAENRRDRYAHGTAHVTPDIVIEITRAVRGGMPKCEAGRRFGLSDSYIGKLSRGERWPHIDRSGIPQDGA